MAALHTAVCTLLVKNIHIHTLNLTFVLNMWDNTTTGVNRTHISLHHTLPFVLYWLEHTHILNPEHVRTCETIRRMPTELIYMHTLHPVVCTLQVKTYIHTHLTSFSY